MMRASSQYVMTSALPIRSLSIHQVYARLTFSTTAFSLSDPYLVPVWQFLFSDVHFSYKRLCPRQDHGEVFVGNRRRCYLRQGPLRRVIRCLSKIALTGQNRDVCMLVSNCAPFASSDVPLCANLERNFAGLSALSSSLLAKGCLPGEPRATS